jgi:DNA repair exonuclease SbcCD ATPase subunit
MAEKQARVLALEEELATLRGELENEKTLRATDDADAREREHQAQADSNEMRAQLGDITNLIQDQREACEQKKALMEERWNEKQERRQTKEFKWVELRDMVQKIHDDMEADRNKAEEARLADESKPGKLLSRRHLSPLYSPCSSGVEKIIEELQQRNNELRDLLTSVSESTIPTCLVFWCC